MHERCVVFHFERKRANKDITDEQSIEIGVEAKSR